MSFPDLIPRSYLFAPADQPDLVRKALASSADVVVLDLEDGLTPGNRSHAHELLEQNVDTIAARPTHVRIGMEDGKYRLDEARLAARVGARALRLPKADDPEQIAAVAQALDDANRDTALHLTVESARGLQRLLALIATSSRTERVVFGERDFLADLGIAEPGPLTDHARATIALVSRSQGIGAPIDGAYIHLEDLPGLRQSAQHARQLGFSGKSAIHPRQLPVIHQVFTPTPEVVERARRVVAAYQAAGPGIIVVDGLMVDPAVVRQAQVLLASLGETQ